MNRVAHYTGCMFTQYHESTMEDSDDGHTFIYITQFKFPSLNHPRPNHRTDVLAITCDTQISYNVIDPVGIALEDTIIQCRIRGG